MNKNVFGLIGYPLTHSFSKKYFDEKFFKEKINDAHFELFSIPNIEAFNELITIENLKGLAVTIPYKKLVIPYLNEVDDVVKKLGACNCITLKNDFLKGYNTDVLGFEKSLLQHLKPNNNKALILGTGGAAAAVEFVLEKLNIDYLVVSREAKNNNCITYQSLNKETIQSHTLIINTTPLGTFPDVNDCPNIPYQFLSENHLLFDLVYNPSITKFMQKGLEKGASVANGFDMLVYQAEENWKIWNTH
ncbi:MAG: shikimate dehydrogenase family protein [Chitinophagaceae bacterium]